MTFTPLASSSHGNCYIVSDGETSVLLECGIPLKSKKKRPVVDLSRIQACLVSHEHKDHSSSVRTLLESGVEVFASRGTAAALDCELITPVEENIQFSVGTLEVMPFAVFHDAEEPLGFLLYSRRDGERLAFATDTVNLGYRFPGVNLLALEANHDAALLEKCERMNEKLRQRISRRHMEIGTLCRYLGTLDLSRCRELYLLHLSRFASSEADFVRRVQAVVPDHTRVTACPE